MKKIQRWSDPGYNFQAKYSPAMRYMGVIKYTNAAKKISMTTTMPARLKLRALVNGRPARSIFQTNANDRIKANKKPANT